MQALARSVIVALLCSALSSVAMAEDKEASKATDTKQGKTAEAKPSKSTGGGQYCCSSECCALTGNARQICREKNNNCSCSGKCKGGVGDEAKKALSTLSDPLAKAAASSSECQWDCLSHLRSCLHNCKNETACGTCTTNYGECQARCGPPDSEAAKK